MVNSMTGYASGRGQHGQSSWSWDLRSVNGKGLDIRMRVPDWVTGLESELRKRISAGVGRGSITLGLKISTVAQQTALVLDAGALDGAMDRAKQVETLAAAAGLSLTPMTAVDLLSSRGVVVEAETSDDTSALGDAILADFDGLIREFNAMRAGEGATMFTIISDQLTTIDGLVEKSIKLAESRKGKVADTLRANLIRVMENTDNIDENRIAQELALLAVKADVTEELDRLGAHIAAAAKLLQATEPVGRRLDFLMQEFNREANTLCSKSQSVPLTELGLDLKATIDQMREQIQNVE